MINPTITATSQIKSSPTSIDEEELVRGITPAEAKLLVNAIAEYHGVKVFKDVARDVIEAFTK